MKQALGALPEGRRKIITNHDAFGYFGAAYGLEIIAPEGVSTESEASAQDVAKDHPPDQGRAHPGQSRAISDFAAVPGTQQEFGALIKAWVEADADCPSS